MTLSIRAENSELHRARCGGDDADVVYCFAFVHCTNISKHCTQCTNIPNRKPYRTRVLKTIRWLIGAAAPARSRVARWQRHHRAGSIRGAAYRQLRAQSCLRTRPRLCHSLATLRCLWLSVTLQFRGHGRSTICCCIFLPKTCSRTIEVAHSIR